MNPDVAKAALSLCPPLDETNPDVPQLAEARDFAATNTALAAWWEEEKNFDVLFSQKLANLKPPVELLPTILRGGATIFYASRLIAESTSDDGDDSDPIPHVLTSPAAASLAETGKSTPRNILVEEVPESPVARRWFWRLGLILVCVIGLLLLLFLFTFEFDLASKDVAIKARSGPVGEVGKIETISAALDSLAAPAVAAGPSVAEMQKYLDDNRSPNPTEWPVLITHPPVGVVVTVAAETWNFIPITHFTIQSGVNLSHLIILRTENLHLRDGEVNDFRGKRGAFDEQILTSNGYIYIKLTPSAPKS